MRIRAGVPEQFGEPLVVQELELDEPTGHEALVRLVACGVCHTDLYTATYLSLRVSGLRKGKPVVRFKRAPARRRAGALGDPIAQSRRRR
jgi:D-arabinose 1-dehydrogenase-like Zn-dependent alcohol dehydrogenase